jgi:hypothetical protein
MGSYGALPSSYQGSGASSESLFSPEEEESAVGQEERLGEMSAAQLHRNKARRRPIPATRRFKDVIRLDSMGSDTDDTDDDEGDEDELVVVEGESENEDDHLDNSPYPEVRASVLATDDTSLSINTPRMWTLSLLFTLAGSATNLFFSLRYPSVSITPVIALLLAHPLGKIWDRVFPESDVDEYERLIKSTSMLGKWKLWLGQGRWNRKEHACVYISSNVSFGFAFATDVRLILDPLPLCCKFDRTFSHISKLTKRWGFRFFPLSSLGNCGTNTLLSPKSGNHLPDPFDVVNTNFGIYICRLDTSMARTTEQHDMARYTDVYSHVYNPSRRGE